MVSLLVSKPNMKFVVVGNRKNTTIIMLKRATTLKIMAGMVCQIRFQEFFKLWTMSHFKLLMLKRRKNIKREEKRSKNQMILMHEVIQYFCYIIIANSTFILFEFEIDYCSNHHTQSLYTFV